MMTSVNVLFFSLCFCAAAGQTFVAFDTATASSVYSSGSFKAQEATTIGSGYWCSSGEHSPGQSVSWTGTLGSRYKALGVKINWAYGPGERKLLISGDGGNFAEAACWSSPSRSEVAYEEVVMFESPLNVKSLTIAMRSVLPWAYFGISDVSLIVEPSFPSMLVSSVASAGGEMCVVAADAGVRLAPCLLAIAAGDGREIFQFVNGALKNAATGACVTLANGDAAAGTLIAAQCPTEEGDGRSSFSLTAKGELKLGMGNYCVVSFSSQLSVQDCVDAGSSRYYQVGVPEFDVSTATSVREGAAMVKAAAERQASLLAKLKAVLPKLSSCKVSLLARPRPALKARAASEADASVSSLGATSPAMGAIAEILPAFGVDKPALSAIIRDSSGALAAVASS